MSEHLSGTCEKCGTSVNHSLWPACVSLENLNSLQIICGRCEWEWFIPTADAESAELKAHINEQENVQ